jgi:hypothetical protein
VRKDLSDLVNVCDGTMKQTNELRALLTDLNRGNVPKHWCKFKMPRGTSVGQYITDLCARLAQLERIATNGPSAGGMAMGIWLGGLFQPEAYITATRQAAAHEQGWSLEQLALTLKIEANPEPDAFILEGESMFPRGSEAPVNGVPYHPGGLLGYIKGMRGGVRGLVRKWIDWFGFKRNRKGTQQKKTEKRKRIDRVGCQQRLLTLVPGLKLHGALWENDKIALNDGQSVALGPSLLAWTRRDDSANANANHSSSSDASTINLPVYLNGDRSEVLFAADLVADGLGQSVVAQRGVCITAV